jgi:Tfp pilus assembly protein PilV
MNTLQNAVVRNMVASLQVPTFNVGYTITTDNLDKLYQQIKSKGVTMTALLASCSGDVAETSAAECKLRGTGNSVSCWNQYCRSGSDG